MKIVHLCLACFFPDNYSYQENMLPKFHKELGYSVEVIASLVTFDKNGKAAYIEKASTYQNEYDIKVTRLDYKRPEKLYRTLKRYVGTYDAIVKSSPDVLFIHGCQFRDIDKVVKYINQHPNVRVYVDNHADFSNSATNWVSRNILHRIVWKRAAHLIEPYTTKFYGVLPARVDFLKDVYKLPPEKCELLVMGADDEKVMEAKQPGIRQEIREKYGIHSDDFLIMTGGKIDMAKRQTLLLMQAVAKIQNPKVKLIVFGSVVPEMKDEVASLVVPDRVQYIGWVQSDQSDKYFGAADLVVFPGRHSVFWEQVAGLGIPMICKYWEGTTHIDLGGNVEFLHKDSADEIYEKIMSVVEEPGKYKKMKCVAEEKGMETFSYRKIAERCIE
ncbi:MAG: glycosyltransferase family 4 protein [Ruminococcus sp.]|nr:glycosyltransferase family 4 protein [Ruminococcus sp.]